MNTWSQQQEEELHESFVNRLYECKPVKIHNTKLQKKQLQKEAMQSRKTLLSNDDLML